MSAVTTGPTGAANKAAGVAGNGDTAQNTSGDFIQMIAELIGGAPATTATPASAAITNAATTDADESSTDNSHAATPDSALTDMLALGLQLPYAPVVTPAPAATNAQVSNASSGEATDLLAANGVGGAGTDPLRMQQLAKLLAKDATTANASDKQEDGVGIAALLNKTEAAVVAAPAPTPNQAGELLAKLQDSNDNVAQLKPSSSHQAALDQVQQANLAQVKSQDVVSDQRPQFTLHSRVGSHEWTAELGNKLTLISAQNTQSASLQLTPDNLGPVEVKIEVKQGQASVWFTADQADTRTALEQSLPKLRELFAAQGMSLTDAGVFGQRSQQQQPAVLGGGRSSVNADEMGSEETAPGGSLSLGLLDTYA